ncbi:hypothetical protein HN51_005101 [Arachis hypogaea]
MATTLLYTIGNNGTIATALAGRHADGSLHVEDFIIEVKDQSGKKVQLGFENDQRAVMMGLMLDANEKLLIRQETTNMHLKFLLCESSLSEAGHRHKTAIDGLERTNGKNLLCLRLLQGRLFLKLAF